MQFLGCKIKCHYKQSIVAFLQEYSTKIFYIVYYDVNYIICEMKISEFNISTLYLFTFQSNWLWSWIGCTVESVMQALTQIRNWNIPKALAELLFRINKVTLQLSVQDLFSFNMERLTKGYVYLDDGGILKYFEPLWTIFYIVLYANYFHITGRSKTLCLRWSIMWRVSGGKMWWEICTILLCKRHMLTGM